MDADTMPSMQTERIFLPELLFAFDRRADKTRWRCELRDHGEFGVLVELYEGEMLFESQRFSPMCDPERNARGRAIAWAVERCKAIEASR